MIAPPAQAPSATRLAPYENVPLLSAPAILSQELASLAPTAALTALPAQPPTAELLAPVGAVAIGVPTEALPPLPQLPAQPPAESAPVSVGAAGPFGVPEETAASPPNEQPLVAAGPFGVPPLEVAASPPSEQPVVAAAPVSTTPAEIAANISASPPLQQLAPLPFSMPAAAPLPAFIPVPVNTFEAAAPSPQALPAPIALPSFNETAQPASPAVVLPEFNTTEATAVPPALSPAALPEFNTSALAPPSAARSILQEEEQGLGPHERCRAAKCVPAEDKLRQHIQADLRRTPALPNDKPVAFGGLDRAIEDLEAAMVAADGGNPDTIRHTRGGSVMTFRAHTPCSQVFTFREHIDYVARVATSPAIRTVCEVGFYCGQSAVVWLEANPALKLIGFDDFDWPPSRACYQHLKERYPGRIEIHEGKSAVSVPDFIHKHSRNDQYEGPMCDLVHVDAWFEYKERRNDYANMLLMSHCSTLVLFNDVCDVRNCHLFDAQNCYWKQYGMCFPQDAPFFLGSTMVFEDLTQTGVIEKLDTFMMVQEPRFYKSWALGRVVCDSATGKPQKVADVPFIGDLAKFEGHMRSCRAKGGCEVNLPRV
ncbi:hypothetical protein WJX72_004264 [[Myrmecia] bisecta]|uniref:Uncharacterized protein n=1 Tax=[Myrmecia] bisecta TaxID=41462 RepID=A0AAW1P0E4_9CHLO